MDKQDKKPESPSPLKRTPIRRSKSDIKTKSKNQNQPGKTSIRRSSSEIKTKSTNYQNQTQTQNQPGSSSSSHSKIINWVTRKFNSPTSSKNSTSQEKKNKSQQKTVTDAGPTTAPIPSSGSDKEESNHSEEKAYTLTDADADEYYMKYPRRGKAIIFNHEYFEKETRREGTQCDVERLTSTLKELKFEIEIYTDSEYGEVLDIIRNLSREDFTDCDCIAFFILTHGNNKQEIAAKDVYYSIEKVWQPFCADKCPSLAGKPKLFFISACRGHKKDSGKRTYFGSVSKRGKIQADYGGTKQVGYKIPNYADFLMAYSTAEGFYSYRDVSEGTWFIQSLCDMLMEHFATKDLLKILTLTSRKVVINNSSQGDTPESSGLVQIPSITSLLIRDLYFRN